MSRHALGVMLVLAVAIVLLGVAWSFSTPTPTPPELTSAPSLEEAPKRAIPPAYLPPIESRPSESRPSESRPSESPTADAAAPESPATKASFQKLATVREALKEGVGHCADAAKREEISMVIEQIDSVLGDRDAGMMNDTLSIAYEIYMPQVRECLGGAK